MRQITEDKTSRASFYQTVAGLLGAPVRRQLEASIARSCANYVSDYRPAYGPENKNDAGHKAMAESMTHSPASLDDTSSTADVSPTFPQSDTPSRTASSAGGDTAEFNIMMTCLSEAIETEVKETEANESSEAVSAEVAIALETKRSTESITPVDTQIGPLDLALASLDTMYSLIEDDPTPIGKDTLPDKVADSIFATKEQDAAGGSDVQVDPTPESPQSSATGIRAILNRLRQTEPLEPRIEPILEIGGVQPDSSDLDPTDESNRLGADSDQKIAQDCSEEEFTFEHGASDLASATLDALSADLLRQMDAGAHATAQPEYDKGDLAVYARLFGEIASERSDDLHDIYLDDEIFRADVCQFKHFFLHLIKAHIDNDGDNDSDALIRSWLNSPYGCVYKGLYRHCPPDAG
ncbi:hypothetical protein MnTg02_02853 [bacterium MnTg02]|nr:hypothetical protein MnTg02_02853 [bacterium MnTg02]